MSQVKAHPINKFPEDRKVALAPQGRFPVFTGSDGGSGTNVECGHCRGLLCEGLPPTITFDRLVMRCGHCSELSEVTLTSEPRPADASLNVIKVAEGVSGEIKLESPMETKSGTYITIQE